jgi:hypothetical protein
MAPRAANDAHFVQTSSVAEASATPVLLDPPRETIALVDHSDPALAPGSDASPPKVSEALAPPTMNQPPPAIEPNASAPHGPIVPVALHSAFAVDASTKP